MKLPGTPASGLGLKKASKSSETILIELSDSRIKIVSLSESQGNLTVESVAQKSVVGLSDQDVAAFIAQYYKKQNIKSKQLVCAIPSGYLISKNVDMPSSDPEEIKKIIDLQAGRYTPYSREEIVIDYLSSSKPGQHYTNVLLIIVHRKNIDRLLKISELAGLEVSRIVCASEAMALICDQVRQRILQKNSAVTGIHVAEEQIDLIFSDQGQLVFARSIPVGFRHFSAGKESADADFAKELDQSFSAYQSQGIGQPVELVAFSGLAKQLASLEGTIKSSVPYASASSLVFEMIPEEKEFHLSDEALAACKNDPEVSFFSVIASVWMLKSLKLDFVPKEVKLRKKVQEGSRDIIALGVLLMTLILLICVFLGVQIYLKKDIIKRLESINVKTSDQAKTLEQASTKSRVLRNLLDSRGKGLYVFEKISTVIGEDIYLASFSFDKDDIIKLAGTADSMSRVFAFVTELEESQYFKDVKTNSTKSRRQGQREVADFEIECTFSEGI